MDNKVIDENSNNDNKNKIYVKLKNLKFKQERIEVLKKIYTIIGINNGNKTFFSHELDLDENKQKEIEMLYDDIKKYFKTSTWLCFSKKRLIDRKYISVIKYILKDMMIDYTSVCSKMKVKSVLLNTTQYTINSQNYM